VTRVLGAGAELTLAGGHRAFAHKSHLTELAGLVPDQVVRVGQGVRVHVGEGTAQTGRIQASLLPFEPDGWARFTEQYREGMVVEGLVDGLRNFGAFVEIYPGIIGLVPSRRISREWVSHAEDFLEVGERTAVQIVRIAPAEERIELSIVDIPEGAEPERPASIYPEGPPWLPPVRQVQEPEPAPEPEPEQAPAAVEGEAPASEPEPEHEAEEMAPAGEAEAEALEQAITDGRELHGQVGALFAGAERRIEELGRRQLRSGGSSSATWSRRGCECSSSPTPRRRRSPARRRRRRRSRGSPTLWGRRPRARRPRAARPGRHPYPARLVRELAAPGSRARDRVDGDDPRRGAAGIYANAAGHLARGRADAPPPTSSTELSRGASAAPCSPCRAAWSRPPRTTAASASPSRSCMSATRSISTKRSTRRCSR
jgi:predicted RNA-binding protein with RPS1 domain